MNNEEKRKEPEIISESITLAEFIDDYGWDFFVSKQYTEEILRNEIRELLITAMRLYYTGVFTYEFMSKYDNFFTFAESCEQYKRRQITKEDFLNAKDSYLAELSESIYQRRLHRDPFCMRLRSELGIPDPFLLR